MSKVIIAIAFLLLVQFSSVLGEPMPQFIAKVTGTVVREDLITPVDARVRTSTLDNKRIFQEFGASPAEYVLVVDTSIGLVLVPKSASAEYPPIPVLTLNGVTPFLNTKTNVGRFVSATSGSAAVDNLFEGLSGAAQGSFKFNLLNNELNVTKLNFSFIGRGSDVSRDSGTTLLQFKVTSGKRFIQQP